MSEPSQTPATISIARAVYWPKAEDGHANAVATLADERAKFETAKRVHADRLAEVEKFKKMMSA